MYLNEIVHGDCLEIMKNLPDNCIDLTVTSPPYDDLRTYNGFTWDFEGIGKELFRITKDGGVVVWIINDGTEKGGSETLTSFKQALFFKDIGFTLHDTMIWEKQTFTATGALKTRYGQVFEYMFILSKGKIKTFNPIKDRKNKTFGRKKTGNVRQKDGSMKPITSIGKPYNEFGQRFNVWKVNTEVSNKNRLHPAPFPEQLVNDHIISWSNHGDIILDCFGGSGTTAKMAKVNNRNFIHIEISKEYCEIAKQRVSETLKE